jgi:deoxyribose-phosphate aldolase
MTTTTPSDASASANPALSDSQALVRDFLSANPDLASQQLGTPQVMTGRFTNAEWASQIQETVRDVLEVVGKAGEGKKYEVPKIGSREFAQTIDHTLLKLEATGSQIDGLCAEARTEGFKVCGIGFVFLLLAGLGWNWRDE